MTEYLWRVIYDCTRPPEKMKVKKEKKYYFLVYGAENHVMQITKPMHKDSSLAGYTFSSNYFYTEREANEFYEERKKEKEALKKEMEEREYKIKKFHDIELENISLREKLLKVIDFALTICHEECHFADVCDMDSWGERNIERCALKRMKKELQEKEDEQTF